MTFTTPILLLAWRRPEAIKTVINAIRPFKPINIFVACDGPNTRRKGEEQLVAETRLTIATEIDWECNLIRQYSETNLGCKLGVSRAITWFFNHVDEGIILEDDCVPLESFLPFCETLLARYRFDSRIWCISGNNFQQGRQRGSGDYYFSHYNHCWGWATWKRCWSHYESDLKKVYPTTNSEFLISIFDDPVESKYWNDIWQRLINHNKPDTWDYQWTFTCMVNGGLTALPNSNLVYNIGFGGEGATHTGSSKSPKFLNKNLEKFDAPQFVLRDKLADRYTFDHHFRGYWRRMPWSLIRKAVHATRHCKKTALNFLSIPRDRYPSS